MTTTIINTLRELEDALAAVVHGHDWCFRGQRDAQWNLIPSAFRAYSGLAPGAAVDVGSAANVERDTYREFDSDSRLLLPGPLPLLEKIAVAQHHGVPTRCLDWTTNLRTAAYFATLAPDNSDGAVWALNLSVFPFPSQLGRQHRGGGFLMEKVNHYCGRHKPSFAQEVSVPIGTLTAASGSTVPPSTFLVVHPPRTCDRLLQQSGLLSWHHTFDDSDLVWDYSAHIADLERQHTVTVLAKFSIPSVARAAIRRDLRRAGTTPFTLFPDLDGLGRHLAEMHDDAMQYTV